MGRLFVSRSELYARAEMVVETGGDARTVEAVVKALAPRGMLSHAEVGQALSSAAMGDADRLTLYRLAKALGINDWGVA